MMLPGSLVAEMVDATITGNIVLFFPHEIPEQFPGVTGKLLCHAPPLEDGGLRHAFVYLGPEQADEAGFCHVCGEFQLPIVVLANSWSACGYCGSKRLVREVQGVMMRGIKSYWWQCDVCKKTAETRQDKLPLGWMPAYGMHVCSEECKQKMIKIQSEVYCIGPGETLDFETMSIIDWQVGEGKLYLTVDEGRMG